MSTMNNQVRRTERGDLPTSPPQSRDRDQITAEARANRLRTLVEAAGDMVWTVDLTMRPTYVSASIHRHLGYTQKEALQTSMERVFSPESYRFAMSVLSGELAKDGAPNVPPDRTPTFEIDLVHKDGYLVPVEICYTALRDPRGNPVEIMAVARNIAERKRIERENSCHTEKMIAALEQTVQSLAMLLEMRDSYTAGHQRRVADLASAIARELGMPDGDVRGLRLAGLIHDIGKVRVPAEILSCTRRLCAAEFEIIKMHPAIGYEVLREIDFPWPIAETVYQHHERLDGSGYPRGLLLTDIILEARILAVADVVEAIASDRPYRRALGVGSALEEVTSHAGTLYDRDVVDACVGVFQEGSYVFEEQASPFELDP